MSKPRKAFAYDQEHRPRFAVIPYDLIKDERKTNPATLAVYAVISKFADYQTAEAHPGIRLIARQAKTSQRRVYAALDELESLGYLRRANGAPGEVTRYWLIDPWGVAPERRGVSTSDTGCIHPGYGGVTDVDTIQSPSESPLTKQDVSKFTGKLMDEVRLAAERARAR